MSSISKLLELMKALRDPQKGCPWDREQSFATIAPYTIEEAYEVADAIRRDDIDGLRDELGDLLFQVVFHARLAEERGAFDFADVAACISDKMQRRHPHVFGSEEQRRAGPQAGSWERIKAQERAGQESDTASPGTLDGIAIALPALKRAAKLGRRASLQGFDWPDTDGVRAKIAEEFAELDAAVSLGSMDHIEDELGDVLFSIVNLARHLRVDPEQALTRANHKFEGRFRVMEQSLQAANRSLAEMSIEQLEMAWQQAKHKRQDKP
jgi:nucleoside triphosphate diphosphatase